MTPKQTKTLFYPYSYPYRTENSEDFSFLRASFTVSDKHELLSVGWDVFAPSNELLYIQIEQHRQKEEIYTMTEALKKKVDIITDDERYNLPDVRDGLTPRQRRILWAMHVRNLSGSAEYENTILTFLDAGGKYGIGEEMSDHLGYGESDLINDTIAQMTQHYNTVALIEAGRGNFGGYGYGPASPRFTEIRISSVAEDTMLRYVNKSYVQYRNDNYISGGKVPLVLPSCLPWAVILGTDTTADGFVSKIPPHNLGEVIDAMVAMIKDPDLPPECVMDYIQGPDFITGGIVTNKSELAEIYRKGRGQIRIRSKAHVEPPEGRKRKSTLLFRETPITVANDPEALTKWIDMLVWDDALPGVVRAYPMYYAEIGVELKVNADIPKVLDLLYQKTELDTVVDYQAILLSGNEPARMSLHSILSEHLAFYRDFLQKKNGVAATSEEMCRELLAIKEKHAKPRKTEMIDL